MPNNRTFEFWRLTVRREPAGLAELNSDQRGELRAAQIQAILALSPTMILANFFNLIIVTMLFWGTDHNAFLTLWVTTFVVVLGIWLQSWQRSKSRAPRSRASVRGARLMTMNAFVLGAVWAAPIMVMFHDVSEAQRVVLAAVAAGMICGGALALATVWQAALVFSLAIALPTTISLVNTNNPIYLGLAALTISFSFLVSRTVCDRSATFVDSYLANRNLREQGHVISLLLREFEENASDWLWQIDAEGRLAHVSNRMAALFREKPENLIGILTFKLLNGDADPSKIDSSEILQILSRRFMRRAPFRDVLLPIFLGGEQRWWSLSAKPVFDAAGSFNGYRGVGSDVTESKRAEASLERMASFDGLTGLPNRAHFHQKLTHALSRLAGTGDKFAVLSVDLDRFKNVNDTLGHQVGDILLSEVAGRMIECVRSRDVVARFGGDEFVVLQVGVATPEDSAILAARLVKSLSAPYQINNQCVLIGASVGIAIAPDHGDNVDELLRNSDLALYRAKAEGKGDYRYFANEMNERMQSRRMLEIELRDALQNNDFELHFQPLIDAQTGVVTTCETLIRWRHPTRGLISPADFIPVAEETGLIVAIDEWVLRHACEEALGWPAHIRVAVNLSCVQFQSGRVTEIVASALAASGLPAGRLELEITESVLLANSEETLKSLKILRDLGIRISLDDFGTGYSSLSYLSSFRFDKIKIDRSFVRDVAQRPDAAAIIQAITGLAASLGMCTTAEGVESNEELDWLRLQGCKEIQGFLFSRPLPARDLRALIGIRSDAGAKRVLLAQENAA